MSRFFALFIFITTGLVAPLAEAQMQPRKLQIIGFVQSWIKECVDVEERCLPQPWSHKKRFTIEMTENLAPSSVATDEAVVDLGSFIVELNYFWVSRHSRPGLDKGYISIQVKLYQKSPRRLLAESGQYRADVSDTVIPVGYLASPLINGNQYGISFTKQ